MSIESISAPDDAADTDGTLEAAKQQHPERHLHLVQAADRAITHSPNNFPQLPSNTMSPAAYRAALYAAFM